MKTSYKPVLLLFGYIFLASFISYFLNGSFEQSMMIFMGTFFLAFSFFKFLDYSGFVKSYKNYDLLSKALPGWAYLFPFLELFLGIGFLIHWNMQILIIITLLVHTIALIGILSALKKGEKINCACMGTILNVPLGGVTLIENSLMVAMALFMLLS